MTDETKHTTDEFDDMDDEDIDLSPEELAIGEDIELITSYLNGHLDPERLEAVRKRLDEDEAFRDLAAPLILTWSIPKHIVRHPRPEGELERSWAEFTRRVGIDQPPEVEPPKPSRWERWKAFNKSTGAKVMFFVALGAYLYGGQVVFNNFVDNADVAEQREYTAVAFDTGWIPLGDGIEVQMPRDAGLKVDERNLDGMKHVVLDGTARFRVLPIDTKSRLLRRSALYVETSAGSVWAGEADFSVTAHDSITHVVVHALGPRRTAMPNQRTVMVSAKRIGEADHLALLDLEGARMLRGRHPERLPARR